LIERRINFVWLICIINIIEDAPMAATKVDSIKVATSESPNEMDGGIGGFTVDVRGQSLKAV
jgi:hypothetical protein